MNTIKTQAGYKLAYSLAPKNNDLMPILYVHGFPLDHRSWRHDLSIPRAEIMVDLPGFGASTLPAHAGNMLLYAKALIEVLDHLGIPKVILCGHSMGGYVCLEALSSFPDRVSGLVLVGSQPLADPDAKKLDRQAMIGKLMEDGIQTMFGFAGLLAFDGKEREFFHEIIASQKPEAAVFALQAMIGRRDHSQTLLDAIVPVLVVHGDSDDLVPLTAYPNGLEAMGARIHVIPGVGHSPMVENPALFFQLLLDWLGDSGI